MLHFKKDERFYHIYLQRNFFDGITIVCTWGTFDSRHGGYKHIFCDNMQEVDVALEDIKNTRLKRGYKAY